MLVECVNCGKRFIPKTYRHKYCSRKCYILGWRGRLKKTKYPIFKCPECGKENTLNFYPLLSSAIWREFKCSECGYWPMSGLGSIKEKK